MGHNTRQMNNGSHHGAHGWSGGNQGTSDPKTRDGQAFSYLGPGPVEMDINMMGSEQMADGRRLRTWQFGRGFNDDRSVPGPVIEGIEGRPVEVTLRSHMPHTIHFHGLDVDQANDGVPGTSGYVGGMGMGDSGSGHGGGNSMGMGGGSSGYSGGNSMGMGSVGMEFGRVAGYNSLGSPFTYRFIAPHAGTYMYHCHVDTVLHLEMGMYGTVIIRPPESNDGLAWAGGPALDREYIWHLHTFDSTWHSQMVSGPRTVRHRPDYFMINGRDGASSLNDPTSAILAAPGERVLVRLVNVGYQPALVTLGGLEFTVIASDGRPLPAPLNMTEYLVSPGERYDIMFKMPPGANYRALVEYLDIRMRRVLGHASTRVESL
jgi:FtsP/CotA-like multicopper oxidase with cupredoxin domain